MWFSSPVLKRPDLDDTVGHSARGSRHTVDGVFEVRSLDHSESSERQIRAHEGSLECAYTGSIMISHLHGVAGYSDEGPVGS
jgi:hypothetical protein